jgi:hypothetical protein
MCDESVPRLALSVPDFGASIGVGRRKAYELAGQIGVRVDGRLIVPVTAIERWLEGLHEEGTRGQQ